MNNFDFESEVKQHYSYLYNVACYYLNDTHLAHDALQDTLLKVYKSLDKFRHDSSFKTYITRVLINQCLDYQRKKKVKQVTIIDFDLKSNSPTPHESLEQGERSKLIYRCLQQLSTSYKEIIILKDIQGLSYDEISEVLDIPLSSVKTRLHRSRNALREIISKEEVK